MKLARSVPQPDVATFYAAAYLLGGSSATSVIGTWQAVTDGSFTITIDGTEYDITGLDFSGDSDMDDVAATIQAGIRAATSGSELVFWDTDHFVIQSADETADSEVSVTSAEGTGTDISGAGGTAFMDAETGRGTAVAALLGYQTLTTSFATLGVPFSIAHAGQLSLKPRHKATASGEKLSVVLEVSDDDIETSEASSKWHPAGSQDAAGGSPNVITEQDYQYDYTSTGTTEHGLVPLRYTEVAKKARIRVKCDKPVGRVRATCGLVEH